MTKVNHVRDRASETPDGCLWQPVSNVVKICGLTNSEDAAACLESGADLLGFVFYQKSPRYLTPPKAQKIIDSLPRAFSGKVGVFVNEKPAVVRQIAQACRLDYLQFHGDESPDYLKRFQAYMTIKAVRISGRLSLSRIRSYRPALFLCDTYRRESFGGTGEVFDWELLSPLKKLKTPFLVSGGLTPRNVTVLLRKIRPFGVDVSSGVERAPGLKDRRLVRRFIKAVKGYDS